MRPDKPDFNERVEEFLRHHAGAIVVSKLTVLLEESYNRGFSDGQDSRAPTAPNRPCYCGKCSLTFFEQELKTDLDDIPHVGKLLTPGTEVPVGECPNCGTLAYLAKSGKYGQLDVDWLEDNVAKVLAKKYGDGTTECCSYITELILRGDPHTAVAAFMFNKNPTELGESERTAAKTELFKLIYGGS